MKTFAYNALSVSALAILLTGCGGSSSINAEDTGANRENETVELYGSHYSAAISTVSSGFDASEVAVVNLQDDDLSVVDVVYEEAESDITVAAYSNAFYRIGRANIDAIARYDVTGDVSFAWEYESKDDTESSSNVYDMVFVNDTKAYLIRYGSEISWIVNPSAATEDEFKIGELDLSAYSDSDGLPEAAGGVIADGKLFIIMQRIDRDNGWAPSNTSYVAVFDVETDQEIETGQGGALKGIALDARNTMDIDYVEGVGLFVQSMGPFFGADYTGGIEQIDLNDYSVSYLLDDGDEVDHPYDRINKFAVVNDDSAYFVSYSGWQNTALYRIDPETADISNDVVAELEGVDIRDITRGPEGNLWVSIAHSEDPRVLVIDPETDNVVDTIETELNPTNVVFTEERVLIE